MTKPSRIPVRKQIDAKLARYESLVHMLLAAVEQWAREHGFKEIASDAESENRESIAAHAACGFVETCRAVHFIKRINL